MARQDRFGLGTLGRLALAALFVVASRLRYAVAIDGLVHDTGAPRTYLAITHKRDMDSVAPLPRVLAHRGWRALAGDVHFAMRGDSFERGFLARMVMRPRLLSWLLRPISVGPILRAVGVHPIEGLYFRPAESWLREALRVEGDGPAGGRLAPAFLAALSQAAAMRDGDLAALPLSHLLTWRFQAHLQRYAGPDIFMGAARRRAERRLLATARRQIDDLAAWLKRGGSLYSSPEGRLSSDGRISPLPAGLARILRAASTPEAGTQVQPIIIVYDYMTVRRIHLFIGLGPAIEAAGALTPRELELRLRTAWLTSARFTCTQLASGFLRERLQASDPRFTPAEMAAHVHAHAVALSRAGRHVDPRLLHAESVRQRTRAYLTYCRRRGLIRRPAGDSRGVTWQPAAEPPRTLARGEPGYNTMPLTYACNELDEMLAAAPPEAMGPVAMPNERTSCVT